MKSAPLSYALLRVVPFLSLIAFACTPPVPSSGDGQVPSKKAIGTDSSVEAFFDQELGPILQSSTPGAVVAVVRDGRPVLLKGYGYANAEEKIPADPKLSTFRAGSISKTVTVTALMMKLHEKGIRIEEPAERYLPGVLPEQKYGTILIQHLITHTAGLDEGLIGLGSSLPEKEIRLMDALRVHFPAQIRRPGFAHVYSNHGMAAAGGIYENLAERPFVEAIGHDLLDPLGMRSSAFYLRDDVRDHLSRSYTIHGSQRIAIPNISIAISPAGSLYTTAADMVQFLRLHMGDGSIDGRRIVPAEVIEQMHARHFVPHPAVPGSALAFYERFSGSHRGLEHAGDWEGFASQLIVYPNEHIGYFISMNGSPSALFRDGLAARFSSRFLSPSSAQPASREGLQVAADQGTVERSDPNKYAGTYRWARFPHSGFLRAMALVFEAQVSAGADGTLQISMTGLPDRVLHPSGDDGLFYEKDSALRVFFHQEKGRIIGASAGGIMLPFFFERVPAFETRNVQVGLLLVSLLVFTGVLLFRGGVGILHLVVWLRNRRKQGAEIQEPGSSPSGDPRTRVLLLAVPGLALAFLLCAGIVSTVAGNSIMMAIPLSLRLVLWMPLILIVLLIWLLYRIPRAWPVESLTVRIQLVLVPLASLLFLIFLHVWNITGWQQG